jgi:hypothetical protein
MRNVCWRESRPRRRHSRDQRALDQIDEVVTIVCHENKTARADLREDRVIGRASQAKMGDVVRFKPKLMRDRRQLGAEALVNQQRIVHTGALVCQGCFLGRPGGGWF